MSVSELLFAIFGYFLIKKLNTFTSACGALLYFDGLQSVTKRYGGLQGVTGGYKGLQEVTRGYRR